jgi:hypothetical protein
MDVSVAEGRARLVTRDAMKAAFRLTGGERALSSTLPSA